MRGFVPWVFAACAVAIVVAVIVVPDRRPSRDMDELGGTASVDGGAALVEPRRARGTRVEALPSIGDAPDTVTMPTPEASVSRIDGAESKPSIRNILEIGVGEVLEPAEAPFDISVTTFAPSRPTQHVKVNLRPMDGKIEVELPYFDIDEGDLTANVWISHPHFTTTQGLFALNSSNSVVNGPEHRFAFELPLNRCGIIVGRVEVDPAVAALAEYAGRATVYRYDDADDPYGDQDFHPTSLVNSDGSFEVKLERLSGEIFVIVDVAPLPSAVWRGQASSSGITDIGTLKIGIDGFHRIRGVVTVGSIPLPGASLVFSRPATPPPVGRSPITAVPKFGRRSKDVTVCATTDAGGRFETAYLESGPYDVSLVETAAGAMDRIYFSPSGIPRFGYFMHPAVIALSRRKVDVPSESFEMPLPISRLEFRAEGTALARAETIIVVTAPDGSVFQRALTSEDLSRDPDFDRGLWVPADTDFSIRVSHPEGSFVRRKIRSATVGEVVQVSLSPEGEQSADVVDILVRTNGPHANSLSRIEAILESATVSATTSESRPALPMVNDQGERRRFSATVLPGRPGVFRLRAPGTQPGKYRLALRFDGVRNRFHQYGQVPRADGQRFATTTVAIDVGNSRDIELEVEPRVVGQLRIRARLNDGRVVFPQVEILDENGRPPELEDSSIWLSPAIDDALPPTGPDWFEPYGHPGDRTLPAGTYTAELTLTGHRKTSVKFAIDGGKTKVVDVVLDGE